MMDMAFFFSSHTLSFFSPALLPLSARFPASSIHTLFRISCSSSSSCCIHRPLKHSFGKPLAASQDGADESPRTTTSVGEDMSSFSAFHGRRGLLFMTTLLFTLPPYQASEGFDASAEQHAVGTDKASIIRAEVRRILSKGKAAGVLRLAFHDAGTFDMKENTGGMNGSIVYELDRPENGGLSKSLKVLEKVKTEVDKVLEVSWADLIAVAGSEAVALCGGPVIPVQLGRIDTRVSDPPGKLPEESLDASGLKRCFQEKGFSTQELVALSGAHTLGSKGFGNPTVFDNSYFKILLEKPWTSSADSSSMIGLPSDRALVEDDECLRWIKTYAGDQTKFFNDFNCAYTKLVNSGASWREVEICAAVQSFAALWISSSTS